MAKWEVQPGSGARILAGLSEDVRQRASLGPPTPQLRADMMLAEEAAEAIINRGIGILRTESLGITSNQLFNRLMGAERRSLAMARIGSSLLEQVEQFERKSYLDADLSEWRAHLGVSVTALVDDAVFWEVTSGWPRTRERETKLLGAGERREGRFTKHDSFISYPALGGRLTLMSGLSPLGDNGVTVTGLVSPETGEPQVELEVLARAG